ncbi:RNA polymerase sigma 70 [Kosmotoga arenicorallina S304]|uniref:RNA polymerase sigma factor n=1 Tax=Kosmotoga arenicorallina S304 TaxID=1453497 RepID=A0A182C7Z2_9BACT|nr:sigma-70 family RNA polymerase sigma factor [Kosmotoga arenicorallina]OAA31874.1 RNA polymerase sigma 70 [Kosmotoga arenicorallina S304]
MDEKKLVEGLKKKQLWAYEVLYDRYARRLGSVVKSYLGVDDIDDVIQETFIKVFKNIKKFKGNSKLSTWLYRIAVNICKDIIAKRKRQNHLLVDFQEGEDQYISEPPATTDVFKEVMDELSFEELMDIIAKLSEEDRLLIKLRDIEGMTYDEIAEILEKPVGTVKSRLHYARKRLRELLEEVEYDV